MMSELNGNQSVSETKKGRPSNARIAFAIIVTLIFAILFSLWYYDRWSNETWYYEHSRRDLDIETEVILFFICYVILHPIIGKVLHSIMMVLTNVFDRVYNLKDGMHYLCHKSTLLIASLWPITAPIILVITLIGIVFGWMFKSLFHE